MLGRIFGIMTLLSLVYGIATGHGAALSDAVIDGASRAVSLTVSLCGIMALWCGIMRVLEAAGIIPRLARLMMPLIRIFFPDAAKSGLGVGEIASNISANLLGIGNAATPSALAAMKKLQLQNSDPELASADMITLAVLNTAPLNIIPTTLIALRRAEGSSDPYRIILPVWICSLATSTLALVLCRLMRLTTKRRRQK